MLRGDGGMRQRRDMLVEYGGFKSAALFPHLCFWTGAENHCQDDPLAQTYPFVSMILFGK